MFSHVHDILRDYSNDVLVRYLMQVRIYVADPTQDDILNSIDAVAIESHSRHSLCESCNQRSYVIARHPPFERDGVDVQSFETADTVFTDE